MKREAEGVDEWLNLLKNRPAYENDYLKERLVTNQQVEKFGVLENSEGVIFPIKDREEKAQGAQIRHYERSPKYQTFGSKQALWPMNQIASMRTVCVTEGVFGVLRADRYGIPATCLMGSNGVEKAAKLLRAHFPTRNVTIVMDKDFAGLSAAGKFILHGFGAIIDQEPPDEMLDKWNYIWARKKTYDVNEIIELADWEDRRRLELQLKKYWRYYIR
jgi:DNA primase